MPSTSSGSHASSRWTSSTERSTAQRWRHDCSSLLAPRSSETLTGASSEKRVTASIKEVMTTPIQEQPLEAKSPFELRVSLGKGVPESDVRSALATGDMGFLHSFTTGATVDGPGVRVIAWTTGCMWRCRYCHHPDTWTMSNGIPVKGSSDTQELRKYRHG